MANPFLVLGGIAVGIVVATFGVLQVPGWVKSAQDASAINDLASAAIGEATSANLDGKFLTGAELAANADKLGMNFTLSAGVKMCVSTNTTGARDAYAALAQSPSGAFFARTADDTKAFEGATPAEALAGVGGTPAGVPDPWVDGDCAPGTEVPNHTEAGVSPELPLGSDPNYQPYDAMFTLRSDTDAEVFLPLLEANGTATWSDGRVQDTEGGSVPSRTLEAGKTYTVTFEGTFNYLTGAQNPEAFISMDSWSDESGTTYADHAFAGMVNLVSVPANLPPTVSQISNAFEGATSFNDADVAKWDVSNLSMASNLFSGATAFQQNINGWHFDATDGGVNLSRMFENTNYTGDLHGWSFEGNGGVQALSFFKNATYAGDMSGWTFENEGSAQLWLEADSFTGQMNDWTFKNGGYAQFYRPAIGSLFDVKMNKWTFENDGYAHFNLGSADTSRVQATEWKVNPTGSVENSGQADWNNALLSGAGDLDVNLSGWTFGGTGERNLGLVGNGELTGTLTANDWTFTNKGRAFARSLSGSGDIQIEANRWTFENIGNGEGEPGIVEANAFLQGIGNRQVNINNWKFRNDGDVQLQAFAAGSPFNGEISGWVFDNTGQRLMPAMFTGTSAFNQDISNWTFSGRGTTIMPAMFQGAQAFNQNLSSWDVSSVVEAGGFADGAPHMSADKLPAFN